MPFEQTADSVEDPTRNRKIRYASFRLSSADGAQDQKLDTQPEPQRKPLLIEYPRHHWSLASNCLEHCRTVDGFICILRWRSQIPLIVRLNPTDCRGYRLIVTVSSEATEHWGQGDCCTAVSSTFNRLPSVAESCALMSALGFLALTVGPSMGLLGQIFVAGNNAIEQEIEEENEEETHSRTESSLHSATMIRPEKSSASSNWVVGTRHEMSLIHGHVVFRGPPNCNRFAITSTPGSSSSPSEDRTLEGPRFPLPIMGAASVAGAEFQLRGPKVPWSTEAVVSHNSALLETAAVFQEWLAHHPDVRSIAQAYDLHVQL
jgi:hypothetical protein